MIGWCQASDPCIRTAYQPALVLAFARDHELDEAAVMAGTGMAHWNPLHDNAAVSAQQYLTLLHNVSTVRHASDTSFLLGQHMLPGHFGAVSHALLQASCLRDALTIMARYPATLCPLLTPRLAREDGMAILYWTESFGSGATRRFLVDMEMAAMTGLVRWLSGEHFPWHFYFNRTQPRYTEQHEVHLGAQLHFNCHLDALMIEASWLDRPWPRGHPQRAALALQAAGQIDEPRALLSALYDYLQQHIRHSPTLEGTASAFGVSPATLKRHLSRHGSHFQSELDQVRAHISLQLMRRGYDNEALARYLGFHDANNFRRSFKRWTGVTPLLLRAAFASGSSI